MVYVFILGELWMVYEFMYFTIICSVLPNPLFYCCFLLGLLVHVYAPTLQTDRNTGALYSVVLKSSNFNSIKKLITNKHAVVLFEYISSLV